MTISNQTGNQSAVKSTPKDVFFYLLIIFSLYISVISFLVLTYTFINRWLPEAGLFVTDQSAEMVMGMIAVLIVAWPVLVVISWLVNKDARKNPGKQNLKVKRWLNYLTLLIASIVVIVSLIILVTNLLQGQLSLRVVLQIVATLVIAGVVLGYYAWELKNKMAKKFGARFWVGVVSSLAVVAAIVLGFVLFGTPFEQRARSLDRARANDLQMLQGNVQGFYVDNGFLPESLAALAPNYGSPSLTVDPVTGEAYEYQVTDKTRFKLCAVFETDTTSERVSSAITKPGALGSFDINGQLAHPKGRACFETNVNNLLPPLESLTQPKIIRN